ncbi:MAG: uncharacterized protein K0R24_2121 [Gammaproteobacteria bacterium]|jgi:hypothetical protein|nr:uncharacterized protein [Gammaproteobacteria bacterium]
MTLKRSISIEWDIDDVLEVRPNLTKLQACKVLAYVLRKHDANIGINWDVLECFSDMLFPDKSSENN